MLKVTCDCGANYTVREELAGKKGRCKKCGNTFTIPSPEPALEPEDSYAMIEAAPLAVAPAMATAVAAPPRRSLHAAPPREPHDPKREMSKGLYVGGYIAGLVAFPALGFIAVLTGGSTGEPPPAIFGVLILLAFPMMLLPMFCMGLITYRMWEAIQDGEHARCRPGSATILLFVPIVNIFWYFKAWGGWAEDYLEFCRRNRFKGATINEGLGRWIGILMLLSIVPVLGMASIANLVLIPMFMAQAVDGVNALLRQGHRPQRSSVKGMGIGSMVYGAFGIITAGIMGAIGLLLGIMGLIAGRSRDGEPAPGRGWVVGGIGVSVASMLLGVGLIIALAAPSLFQAREVAVMTQNMSTGKELVNHIYTANLALGHIPPADQWYEPVLQSGDSRDIKGDKGHVYAMNAQLAGVRMEKIQKPDETVLFFEAAAGSDISGGRDLLPMFPQHHGYLVVFADGSVHMMRDAQAVRRLTWTPVVREDAAPASPVPAAAHRESEFAPPPPPGPRFEAEPLAREFAPPPPPPRNAEEARQWHEQRRAEMEARHKQFVEESERRAAESRARFEEMRRQREQSQGRP